MQIQAINNNKISFGKTFTRRVFGDNGREYVLEYENPNAKKIFKKFKKAKSLQEKAVLLEQLGEYHMVDVKMERQFNNFVKNGYKNDILASGIKIENTFKTIAQGVKTIISETANCGKSLFKLALFALKSKKY